MKLNIPNQLSILRIILVPFMVFFYMASFIPWGKFIALCIYIIAAFTDLLDGKIARKYNMCTKLGNFLDTNADKILSTTGLLLLAFDPTITAVQALVMGIISIVVVSRDYVVAAVKEMAASGGKVIRADQFGRIKATITMAVTPMAMAICWNNSDKVIKQGLFVDIYTYIVYAMLAVMIITTIGSMINYVVKNKEFLKEE